LAPFIESRPPLLGLTSNRRLRLRVRGQLRMSSAAASRATPRLAPPSKSRRGLRGIGGSACLKLVEGRLWWPCRSSSY
jgi:hypothetical protein